MDEFLAVLKECGIQHKRDIALDAVIPIQNEYNQYWNVRRLLTEDKWAYYALTGVTGLREQILLDEARKNIRRAWKAAFGKVPDNANPRSGDKESQPPSGEASSSS